MIGAKTVKKEKNYISEIDQLLAELRTTVPESKSQLAERAKYQQIAFKRDNVVTDEIIEIWEEF